MYLERDAEATCDPSHPGICSSAGIHETKMDPTLNNFSRRHTLGREGWAPCPEAAVFDLSVTHGPCHCSLTSKQAAKSQTRIGLSGRHGTGASGNHQSAKGSYA